MLFSLFSIDIKILGANLNIVDEVILNVVQSKNYVTKTSPVYSLYAQILTHIYYSITAK